MIFGLRNSKSSFNLQQEQLKTYIPCIVEEEIAGEIESVSDIMSTMNT